MGLHGRVNLRLFDILLMNAHLTLRMDEIAREVPSYASWRDYFQDFAKCKATLNSRRPLAKLLVKACREWESFRARHAQEGLEESSPEPERSAFSGNAVVGKPNLRRMLNEEGLQLVRQMSSSEPHFQASTDGAQVRCIVCCERCRKGAHAA